MSKEDLDKQIWETEHRIEELKKGPKVKRASVILSHGTQIGSISFFDDLRTIFILGKERYTSRHGAGERAFWSAAAYAVNLGHKIKNLQVG